MVPQQSNWYWRSPGRWVTNRRAGRRVDVAGLNVMELSVERPICVLKIGLLLTERHFWISFDGRRGLEKHVRSRCIDISSNVLISCRTVQELTLMYPEARFMLVKCHRLWALYASAARTNTNRRWFILLYHGFLGHSHSQCMNIRWTKIMTSIEFVLQTIQRENFPQFKRPTSVISDSLKAVIVPLCEI